MSGPPSYNVPVVEPHMAKHRRSKAKLAFSLLLLVGLVAGAVFVALQLTDDDGESSGSPSKPSAAANRSTTPGKKAPSDPRVAAIEGFCRDPRPLTQPKGIAPFEAGKGAVAYVEAPQPASSTEPAGHLVVQVSPTMGEPTLKLTQSVSFVSVAVCIEQSGSSKVGSTCDFELTNPKNAGERKRSDLIETTYRARIYELSTGKAIVTDTIATPTDVCPEFAYLGGSGVSNPLSDDRVLAWIADRLPGGKPR